MMKLSGVSKTKSKQIGKFGFWLCLIWGLIVWAPAFACAQEIPEFELPADAPTSAEFRERGLQFYLKELELYQEKTQDSPEVKKVVAPFIRASLELIANAERDEQPKVREKVTQLAVPAMASGSEDPIFLIHASLSCQHKKEYAQAIGLADRAIEQFDKLDSYPRAMRSVLIWRFVSMELGNGQFVNHWRGKVDPWRDEVYKELPEFLVYGASLPEGHRHTFAFLNKIINAVGTNDQDAAKQLKLIGDVVDEYSKHEDKDDWLLEMANGAFLRKMAWKLRGSGFAGTVKPRGWAKFGELMPKASQHFRAAYELHPEYPEAAAKLIGIAMAGHDDESTWHWFEKAIAAEVDHTPAYDSMSWALRPRWGGSHDAMIEFGKRCNASGRYDTLVPMELPFKLINIKSEGVSWKEIFKRPGLFDEVMDCCEKLLEDPSRANPDGALRGEWTRVLTNQICLATVADKHEKALELWKKLGDHEPPSYVTRYYNVSPEYSRSRCHAYIEFGDELREMRALAAPPRTNLEGKRKLLAGFEDLVQSSADPGSRRYLEHWVKLCQIEFDFEQGEWVELDFNKENDLWDIHGDWTYDQDNDAMLITSKGDSLTAMYHDANFPGPIEVRAEVTTLRRVTWSYAMAIFIGFGEGRKRFWSDTTRQVAGNENGWTDGWHGLAGPISNQRNELRVKYWNHKSYEHWVDGFRYHIRQGPRTPEADSITIGVGVFCRFPATGSGLVTNVRVRKLTEPPPPVLENHQERADYFSKLIKKHPQHHEYRFERGLERFLLGQTKGALADFELVTKKAPDEHEYHHYYGDLLVRTGRIQEGLQQLELSEQAYPASRFLGRSWLAYHLATLENEELRDVERALEIVKELHDQTKPTVDSQLALAAALIGKKKYDAASEILKTIPEYDYFYTPHMKMYRPTTHADASLLAAKIIEAKADQAKPFTIIPLKGDPKTSARSPKKAGIGLTTNDPFQYSPQWADVSLPELNHELGKKRFGCVTTVQKGKEAQLNYTVKSPHVVTAEQSTIVVDIYGRRLQRKYSPLDNNFEVVIYDGKKEIGKKSELKIPDRATPYVRASFDLKPGSKVSRVKIVAKGLKDKKTQFTLQEIRCAAVSGESDTKD